MSKSKKENQPSGAPAPNPSSPPPTSDQAGQPQVNPQKLTDAEESIKQAAEQEVLILASKINTAARLTYQSIKFRHAKILIGAGGDEKTALASFYEMAEKHGFKQRTVQRRVQTADATLNANLVDTELQGKIEKSTSLESGLLVELETRIKDVVGSTSYTALQRWLGILETDEAEEDQKSKDATAEEKILSKLTATYNSLERDIAYCNRFFGFGKRMDSELEDVLHALVKARVILGSYIDNDARIAKRKAERDEIRAAEAAKEEPTESLAPSSE